MNLGSSIRFVRKIVDKVLVSQVWRKGVIHLLDEEYTYLAHHKSQLRH
ncbi:MAG: hypothetical protein KGI25_00565 [Thaumarchaeota archaeon]|nr:hypothetical protein [Nitrososphaerota archaeon]